MSRKELENEQEEDQGIIKQPAGTKQLSEKDRKAIEREKYAIERVKHYKNIREVLANSNATPIHDHGDGGYMCAFCMVKYPDPADLKMHTLITHKNTDILNASFTNRTNLYSYHVKLDITGLKCSICSKNIDTVEELLEHLQKVHNRKVHTDINSRILPFKFTDGTSLTCFICSNSFVKFKSLKEHVNGHYRNFICVICDAGFVNKAMAVAHSHRHRTGTFECGYCPKVFDTNSKKANHERTAHTHVERQNRCGVCKSTFKHYHHKQKHLTEVHGISCRVKCQACDRSFGDQRKLRVHVRKDHLMERKYQCTHCDMQFFSGHELQVHAVKHTKLKEFQCGVCCRSYGRKKSLVLHMKVHSDDNA